MHQFRNKQKKCFHYIAWSLGALICNANAQYFNFVFLLYGQDTWQFSSLTLNQKRFAVGFP